MFGIGIANGKFGELLQGALPGENTHFLVTLPIAHFSTAKFHCSDEDKAVEVLPSHKIKSVTLVNKILEYFKLSHGWKLTVESQLKEGKGLGSSTADLVACARAITNATGKNLPTEILLRFLKEIEPSDGVMYDGIVCFYHRKVALHSQLGYLSDVMIAAADEGGIIDTIKFNQRLKPYSPIEKTEYTALLDEVITAIKAGDLKKIGTVSTKSAILNHKINPKKNLASFIDISNTIGALGVIVAHSGTYIGILLDKNHPEYLNQLAFIERKMQESSLVLEKFDTFAEKREIFSSYSVTN